MLLNIANTFIEITREQEEFSETIPLLADTLSRKVLKVESILKQQEMNKEKQ